MPYEGGGGHGGGDARGGGPGRRGGVPDGLLVGGLAFLLGTAVLIWSATGLAGLFAHGSWPDGVTFGRTPEAVRGLLAEPHDVPAAWPNTPSEQLSGYGLLWGLFIGQLMVVIVLAVFVLSTVTRWRAVRRAAREAAWHAQREARQEREAQRAREADAADPRDARAPRATPRQRRRGDTGRLGGASGRESNDDASFKGRYGPGQAAAPSPQAYGPAHDRPHEAASGRRVADSARADALTPHPGTPAGYGPRGAAPGPHGPVPGPEAHERHDEGGASPPPPADTDTDTTTEADAYGRPDAAPDHPVAAAYGPEPVPGSGPGSAPATPGPHAHPYLVYAPHSRAAVDAIHDAEGPALVVTADPALYAETVGVRAKLGPAHVYDPAQLTEAPARLRWAPHRGCEHMPTARLRAVALLAPLRGPARIDTTVHDAAETLLRCWLHAAAVAGQPFRQVHRWAQTGLSKDAIRILRTKTGVSGGAAGELESTLTAHPERREEATALVRRALSCVAQVHIRNACTPARADRVAWESFIAEGGTLYVVGETIEAPHRGDPGAMPLLTALTSAVVEHGRLMAERSSAGRLDPPLTLVLDHPATVAPLPELPALLADGEQAGLRTVALLRSEEQARTWWPGMTR